MKEFIEKLIARLEERKRGRLNLFCDGLDCAIKIANELAEESNDGWIPCSGCKDCQHKECEHYGKV